MLETTNKNFEAAASMTDFSGNALYVLESSGSRCTLLCPIERNQNMANVLDDLKLEICSGVEIFVIKGLCRIADYQNEDRPLAAGSYLRLPKMKPRQLIADTDSIVFVKLNQFLDGDLGERIINTRSPQKWLPGPVDGIEIRPLHVFDTESIMLLRWQHAAEFKPRLNPQGEEILVIDGLLQNRDHLYKQFNWIRNPIEDWRKWHGNTGTLIYYKSGHFPPTNDPGHNTDHNSGNNPGHNSGDDQSDATRGHQSTS